MTPVDNLINASKDAWTAGKKATINSVNHLRTAGYTAPDEEPIVFYPTELLEPVSEGSEQTQFPFVEFAALDRRNKQFSSINLPMICSLQWKDSATIDSIDLGIIGAHALAAGRAFRHVSGETTSNYNMDWVNNLSLSGVVGTSAAMYISQRMKENPIAAKSMFFMRRIIPKHTHSTFSGNSIREFAFDFKLRARSESESDAIREIHRRFQKYVYPESSTDMDNLVLDYPPLWLINFYDTCGEDMAYLPRIWSCFLRSCDCTVNQNSLNLFFENGAPIEVDLTLTFIESRVLTRKDIESMNLNISSRLNTLISQTSSDDDAVIDHATPERVPIGPDDYSTVSSDTDITFTPLSQNRLDYHEMRYYSGWEHQF